MPHPGSSRPPIGRRAAMRALQSIPVSKRCALSPCLFLSLAVSGPPGRCPVPELQPLVAACAAPSPLRFIITQENCQLRCATHPPSVTICNPLSPASDGCKAAEHCPNAHLQWNTGATLPWLSMIRRSLAKRMVLIEAAFAPS
jgi:hypothetical protein